MADFFLYTAGLVPARDASYSDSVLAAGLFSSTCRDKWEDVACHNGISQDGSTWTGC